MNKFNSALILILLLNTFYISTINAAVYKRQDVTITSLTPTSVNSIPSPGFNNMTRVYINSAPWDANLPATTCRLTAADLVKADTHMLSILLMAWNSGKAIDIVINDTLHPAAPQDTDVCQIVSINIR